MVGAEVRTCVWCVGGKMEERKGKSSTEEQVRGPPKEEEMDVSVRNWRKDWGGGCRSGQLKCDVGKKRTMLEEEEAA